MLKPVSKESALELASDYHHEEYFRIPKQWRRWSVSAGQFRAIAMDEGGTYYVGARGCMKVFVSAAGASRDFPSKMQVGRPLDCGIFVPFEPGMAAKLFTFIGGDFVRSTKSAVGTTPVPLEYLVGPQSTPQSAAGAAIGVTIAELFADLEKGNIMIISDQPDDAKLRSVLIIK
jgi:hypothetical protein